MAQRDLIDINKDNLYDIIGVQHDATLKQITKNYRKQALKCHPDKNPDPAAHKQFLKLTQILELLSDKSSRDNYDTILKAREAARLRTQQLDAKRRKLKENLEDKEKDTNGALVRNAEKKLQEMIKKLQAEGENILKREEEKLRKEFADKTDFTIADRATLKIKWKCKKDNSSKGYSKSTLFKILQKYGPVSDVIVNPTRKGSALVIFDSIAAAKICMQKETGDEGCPLSFRMLHNTDSEEYVNKPVHPVVTETPVLENNTFSSFPQSYTSFNISSIVPESKVPDVDRDYESLTLMRLRQAEERKRLINEMVKEDEEINGKLSDND